MQQKDRDIAAWVIFTLCSIAMFYVLFGHALGNGSNKFLPYTMAAFVGSLVVLLVGIARK